jgi:hypothetical protein
MPRYKEFVCDLCGESRRMVFDEENPDGWALAGLTICPKCAEELVDVVRPMLDSVRAEIEKRVAVVRDYAIRESVSVSVLVGMLYRIREQERGGKGRRRHGRRNRP